MSVFHPTEREHRAEGTNQFKTETVYFELFNFKGRIIARKCLNWFGFVLFCFFACCVMLSFLIDLITWYLFVQCNAYSPFQAPSSMDCEWKEGWWIHGSSPSSTQQSHGSGWVTRQTGMLWRSIPFLPCSQGLSASSWGLLEVKRRKTGKAVSATLGNLACKTNETVFVEKCGWEL